MVYQHAYFKFVYLFIKLTKQKFDNLIITITFV